MFVQLCPHIRVFLKAFRQRTNQELTWSLIPQGSHKNQRESYYQESSKKLHNCKTFGPQEPQQCKLGFLIYWSLQKEIFIWEWANTSKYDSICSKEPQGSIHKFTISPESAFPKNQKLGFHSVKFICCTKGKIGIFANIKCHDL